jgi:putative oxidoreductase
MNVLFTTSPFKLPQGIAVARIIMGAFLIFHGKEIFDKALMADYAKWEAFKAYPSPAFMAYLGKGSELITGILLVAGLFTRMAALWNIATFLFIVFFVGHGQFWYNDQHPFMFVMVAFIFFFTGPGAWSFDSKFFKK